MMIRRPLFAWGCMLVFGILSALYLKCGILPSVFFAAAFFCIFIFFFKRKTAIFALIFSFAFLTGNIITNIQTGQFEKIESECGCNVEITGKVKKFETHTYSTYVYIENVFIDNNKYSQMILKINNDEADDYCLKTGNTIWAEGSVKQFNIGRNKGNFDEKEYYHSLGVSAIIKPVRITVIDRNINFPEQKLYELKCRIVESFEESVNSDKAGIFAAIVAGDKSGLDEDTKQLYQDSGIAHILAISGLHISLIGMGIFGLLRKKLKTIPASVISSFFMIAFCIMSGSSASAFRATVMFIISLTAVIKGKKYDILSALSLSGIITLISNPYYITNIGFLMSYSAIISIGIINSYAVNFIQPKFRLSKSFIASISITFFSMPLVASTYFQIPLYSVFLNLIVIPLMSFILGSGLLSGFFGVLSVASGRFFIGLGIYLIYFIEGCSTVFMYFPYSVITTGQPEILSLILYYMVICLFIVICIWIYSVQRKTGMDIYMKGIKEKHDIISNNSNCIFSIYKFLLEIKFKMVKTLKNKIFRIIISVLVILILILVIDGDNNTDTLKIVVFDVDQGDCILIRNTNGHVYMIDGGSTGTDLVGKYRIKSGIKYFGIGEIDYVIVTHPDTDHISGIIELLEDDSSGRIKINNICIPYLPGNENYRQLEALCEETDVNFFNISKGMVFTDGDLRIECLHPDKEYYSDSTNGYSAVLNLSFGCFNGLFTGDLETDGEKLLLENGLIDRDNTYELLKVSHHGSKNSTSKEFLEAVKPETALISAGVDNSYGHPSKETLSRLIDIGAKTYITSECGEIIISAYLSGEYNVETMLEYDISD